MPIPKHLRHFYRTPEYRAFRAAVKERSGDKCERCRKPNGAVIETVTRLKVLELRMAWRRPETPRGWRDQTGKLITRLTYLQELRKHTPRRIVVVLCVAHLNRILGDDRIENGADLCQWCHLNHDQEQHLANSKQTRITRKDAARPFQWDGFLEVGA